MAKTLKLSEEERLERGLPTLAREQHNAFAPIAAAVPDAEGGYGRPRVRALDCIDVMLRRGTIEGWMHQAGTIFREDFHRAHLDRLKAADLLRVSGAGGAAILGGNPAGDRVWQALQVLGGFNSPAGSCAYHVIGEGQNLKDWAVLAGWTRNPDTASGILVGTLSALGAHYRLTTKRV